MQEIRITMPDLSTTGDRVRLVRWLVEPGAEVKLGQPLCEVETDKATMEVESITGGILHSLLVQQDEEVRVGQEIAKIWSGEEVASTRDTTAQEEGELSASSGKRCYEKSAVPLKPAKPAKGLFAKNKEKQVTAEFASVAMSGTQVIVAKRMQQSKQTVPHFYLQMTADAEAVVAARRKRKEANPEEKVVWDAFFVQAAAKALEKFERMKCRLENNKIILSANNAIGVAVDIDDNLYVIPVRNPLSKDVFAISHEILSRMEKIQDGDPEAKKLEPANITISNLGGSHIESFFAIVNPPEAAILAIGKIAPVPCVVDNELAIRNQVKLSLSIDHRVVSGKYAANFLRALVKEIETIS